MHSNRTRLPGRQHARSHHQRDARSQGRTLSRRNRFNGTETMTNAPKAQDLPYGVHACRISTTVPILVSLDSVPVKALPVGSHKLVLRGAGKLEYDSSEKGGSTLIDIQTRLSRPGEEIDDKPPPQPAAPDNFLAQIREKVRRDMGVQRESFADFPSRYEVNHDMFEEEEEALAKANEALKVPEDEKPEVPNVDNSDSNADPKNDKKAQNSEKPADQANKNAQ
ncbi:hypothetical protein [Microviridae sp.]|nr:hypothetical protein [Microviridae sp.]